MRQKPFLKKSDFLYEKKGAEEKYHRIHGRSGNLKNYNDRKPEQMLPFFQQDEYTFRCHLERDFQMLLEQKVSEERYEYMLREVLKQITVYEDRVIIHTYYGDIPLKRFLYANKKHFPRYRINIDRPDYAAYLPFDFSVIQLTIQYQYPSYYRGDTTLNTIFKDGNIVIQSIGRNDAE